MKIVITKVPENIFQYLPGTKSLYLPIISTYDFER